tara:strand:- start:7 stop:222 length:216 start_codon:yes stop_codon:yes gene_type:complete
MRQFRSKNQKLVYDYYRQFIEANEYCPTLEEMEKDECMPLTTKTIREHRQTLKEDGYLDFIAGASRGVTLL